MTPKIGGGTWKSLTGSQRNIILAFSAFATAYAFIVGYHLLANWMGIDTSNRQIAWLERCRKACVARGLLPSGNLAVDAQQYLLARKSVRLSDSLAELLRDGDFVPAVSKDHPLVGKEAPDFELADDIGKHHSLKESLNEGPVVVVFYYGYTCSHCVAQLFGINGDIKRFQEIGTTVLAVSADSPELTAKRFKEYGRFQFPVLSDPGNKVAQLYGIYKPPTQENDEQLDHATFVIMPDGKVVWSHFGPEPFVDNKTLLFAIARGVGIKGSQEGN